MSSGNKNDETKNFQNIPNEEEDPKNPNQVFTRKCFTNQYPHTTLVNADYSGTITNIFPYICIWKKYIKSQAVPLH